MTYYAAKLVRLLLLAVSCYGYMRFLSKKVRIEFSISILFTGICCTMFFAGILNILKETAYFILLFGLVLTALSLKRKDPIKEIFCPGIIFFILCAVILLPIMYGAFFTHYDDFSHWGTAVKVLYTQNRFPNFSDKIIAFQSYPVGSSVFIYYFLTVTGIQSEWFQMYVQAIFMIGILSSFFVFAKNWFSWITTAVVSWIFLVCNNGLMNLLVDTLLPIIALGGLCICIYYRDSLDKNILWIIPHMVALVAIKNSGIMFAAFLLLFVLPYFYPRKLIRWGTACLFPLATLLLWQKHVKLVFGNGLTAKHSMSIEHIANTYSEKSYEDFANIIDAYLEELMSPDNPAIYLLLAIGLWLVLSKVIRNDTVAVTRSLVINAVACYFLYAIGMLGMYLTTMPYGEAIQLAGFARYHRSILILCGGYLYFAILILVPTNRKSFLLRIIAYVLVSVLCYNAMLPGLWYSNPKNTDSIRTKYEVLLVENDVKSDYSYCVVVGPEYASSAGYLRYISRYLLNSSNILVCNIEEYQTRESGWKGYDYLICFGESDGMTDFLTETFDNSSQRVYSSPKNG